MGYGEYMKNLLAPMRVYELYEGFGADELDAVGECLDGICRTFLDMERESNAVTAENEGLAAYESILPYIPAYGTTEERRAALCALLSIDGASFSPADIARTLAGCGIHAEARETGTPDTVEIRFPGKRGVPGGIEKLKTGIESILPCHLDIVYVYVYPSWAEIETAFPAWEDIEGMVWQDMERVGEGT